jgi:hypothetical protein
MKGWMVFLALCAFLWSVVHISKLVHNISPSLRVVEDKVDMSNIEAAAQGRTITADRQYFRKIVYKETKQTKGLTVEVIRDTISNEVFYNEDK